MFVQNSKSKLFFHKYLKYKSKYLRYGGTKTPIVDDDDDRYLFDEWIKDEEIGQNVADKLRICLSGYHLTNYLGSGTFGTTFEGCLDKNCMYAVKLVQLNANESTVQAFEKELEISKFMGEQDIGPRIHLGKVCDLPNGKQFGIIVMDKKDATFAWQTVTPEALQTLFEKIQKMHSLGYIHGDMKGANLLVNLQKDNKISEFWLTDFGFAQKLDAKSQATIVNSYLNVFDHYFDAGGDLWDYFETNKIDREYIKNNIKLLDYWVVGMLCERVSTDICAKFNALFPELRTKKYLAKIRHIIEKANYSLEANIATFEFISQDAAAAPIVVQWSKQNPKSVVMGQETIALEQIAEKIGPKIQNSQFANWSISGSV